MNIDSKLKMALGMAIIIVLICILIPFMTKKELNGVQAKLTRYEQMNDQVGLAQELQLEVSNVWQFITDACLTKDKEVIEKEARPAYDSSLKIVARLLELNKEDAAQTAKLMALQKSLPDMWESGSRMFEAYGESQQAGDRAMEDYDNACDKAIRSAAQIASTAKKNGHEQIKLLGTNLSILAKEVIWSGLVAAVMGSIMIATMLFLRRSIIRPLRAILDEVRLLASGEGDLTKRVDVSGKDEIAELGSRLNIFIEKLHGIISEVCSSSQQLASSAQELQSTSKQMRDGTSQLLAQSTTLATAGEEMSATSSDIADNCHNAASNAAGANLKAAEGATVVGESIAVMSTISEQVQNAARTVDALGKRSDQIGAIVETIEDIADQTNLLALNAAIEAARAGEQGRGFAVVADEVRALAERTTRATKEIGEMIKAIQNETRDAVSSMEQSVTQVEQGTCHAAESGRSLEEILKIIKEVTEQIGMIATAAEEQTATTREISSNVSNMNGLAHHNDNALHEISAAANSVSCQAEDLKKLVEFFRL